MEYATEHVRVHPFALDNELHCSVFLLTNAPSPGLGGMIDGTPKY